jgi:hypothetical protein
MHCTHDESFAMPHPKNRLKLTGDTHLPGRNLDLDMDLDMEEDDGVMQPMDLQDDAGTRVYADGYVPPPRTMAMEAEPQGAAAVVEKVEEKVGKQASKAPWLAIGGAIALGFMLMRMVRR